MRRRRGRISNTKPRANCLKRGHNGGLERGIKHGDDNGTRTKKMTGSIGGGSPKRAA